MVNPKVDAHSVMTYISQFPEAKLKDGAPLTVTGDPSKVVVSGPGVGKEIPIEVEVTFYVDTTKAGVGPLNVDIINPDGKRIVAGIDFKDGVYTYKFTAPVKGKYDIKVVWCGKPVPGSTFTVDAFPGAQMAADAPPTSSTPLPEVEATGKGLEEGFVDEWAEFEVDCSKAESGGFEVKIDGPAKAETKITQQPDGKILVRYLPKVAGCYSVVVLFAGKEIPGSPFKPTIVAKASQDEIPTKTKVFELSQIQEGVRLGEAFEFKLDTSKSPVTRTVTAIISGPYGKTEVPIELTNSKFTLQTAPELLSGATFDPEVTNDGGIYTVNFVPKKIGVYALLLFFGEAPVSGTPHFFGVNDPSAVKLTGSGCGESEEVFHVEKALAWEADCVEAGPGSLKAFIFGPEECSKDVTVAAHPDKEDVYNISYTPDVAGSFRLAVTFAGHEVDNCPTLHVSDPSKASVAGIKYAFVGDEVPFKIDLSNAGSGTLSAQLKGPSQQPLTFKDNNDGTGTLSFIATEVGHYELEVKFGEKELTDVPLDVTVIDPTSLKIYGSGFTGEGAIVGKIAAVYIDTTKAGSGSLEVKLTPPEGEEVVLELIALEENPQIFKCHYRPEKIGEYKLEIIFATVQVKGSPFTVPIASPTAVKMSVFGLLFAVPGETCALDCFTESAGPGMLTVDFDGEPLDVQVKPITENHSQLLFAVPDEGCYKATVCYNGVPIASSLKISTGDASKCTVSAIPEKTLVNEEAKFVVDTKEAGKGKLEVSVEGPNDKSVPVQVKPVEENQYAVLYTPEEAGNYTINIQYAAQNLPDSPYTTMAYNPDAVIYTLDTPSIATLGETTEVKVDVSNAGLGEEELEVSLEGPVECPLSCKQIEDDVVYYSFQPEEPGTYTVPICYAGCPISKEPIHVTFVDPTAVDVSGPGVTGDGIKLHQPAEVIVDTSKSGSAPVEAKVTLPSGQVDTLKLEPQDEQHPEVLVASYTPDESGTYALGINFNDQPLADSPYAVYVPKNEEIALSGPGLSQAVVGEPNILDFFMNNMEPEAMQVKFATPEGEEVPVECTLVPINEDHCQVQYVPQEETTLCALPLYAGEPIGEKLSIEAGCPAKCKASGPGLESKLTAGDETWFTVDTSEAGPGALKVCVATPDNVPIKIHSTEEKPGVEKVTYTPTIGGDYEVAVTYNDADIPGSPFPVSVINPKAVSRDLISSPRITLGEPVELEVDTSEAGEGDLDYSVEGPVECPINVCDHGDGAQTLSFTPTAIGTYHVPISYADLPVFEKPIEINVTDPSAVEVSGPGVTGDGIKLHQPAEVIVDTSKSGSAPVEAKVTLPSGEVDTLKFQPKDEQHPEVLVASYTPDESGNYALDVSFDEQPLTDSPYDVYVPKNEEFALSGPGLSQAVVGEPNVIDLFKDNVKPDDVGMKFMSPNGKVVPVECEVKQIDKDHCQIVYVPEEEGALLALPLYAGEPIGNDLSIAVGNPSKCIVSGPGIESKLLAGKRTHFTIDATQAGLGSPKVVITTPSGFKLRKKMRKTKPGVYTVKYTPRMVGQHQVSVKYNKRPVDDSPYAVSVFNPDAVFYKLTEPRPAPFWKSLFRRKTSRTATLGETAEIKVDVTRAGLGEEELSVSVKGPTECSLSCRQTKDDILFYACCPETPGTYKLPITYAGCQISSKKPVQVTFVDPSAVDVSGSGVTGDGIKIRQPAEVIIDTSKSGSAPVEAKVTLPSGKVDTLKLQPKDEQHPEVLVANYKPNESGVYALGVTFNDQPLADSPYAVYVPKNEEIALCGPGLSQAVVDEPNILDMFLDNMEPENLEMKFATPEGQEIPVDCSIVPINEDHCQVQYVPQEETTLCALPLYAGEPIGAKIPIDVACPAKCKASGPGLESKLTAGDETWFTVDTSEAGPGALKVCVATPDNVPIKIHSTEEKPGVEKVTYTPTIGGDYEVAVTYNDADIPGSPFPVSVINPKAVSRDLISSPRITLGEPVELEVDTSEAGEGDLDYSVEGPVECPIDVCDHGDGTQTLSFTPTAIGTYHVPISFAGLPIFDEPIEVTVTDPSAVEVSGPGVTGDGIKLNQPAEVIVDTSKSGSAPVEAKVTLPSGEVDTLKFQPKDEQHPEVLVASYTPDESGNYALDVSFDDEPLTDSPYDVYVPKNEEFAISGPGLSQAVVDEPNVIDLFKDNVKPDDVGMKFMSPNGKVVPVECEVKQIDKDHCQIVYIPEEEGALLALPLYANEPIGNELSIAVAKPSKCIVSGPGVESKLLVGKRTQFTIDATQAGPGSPKVVITTPSGFKLRKKMRKTKLGVYTVKYTPRMVGQHQVSVKYNKRPVGGSPYAVSVFNPYAVSSKLIGPRLIPVGENISFAVDVAKAGEGELNVSVLGPEECKIDAKPTDKDDSYIFSFAPTSTGMYELPVTFDSLPTSRKPASVIITDISKVVASGSGVTGKGALLGTRADVIVDTTESGPAPVKVMLTRPSKKPKRLRMKPKENEPDVLVGHYTPRRSGHYLVQITFGNEPLPQSPYRVYIASKGDIKIAGQGASVAAIGEENVIDFFMENVDEADIGLELTTADEEKRPVHYTMEKVADDHCRIKYSPEVEAPMDACFCYAGSPVRTLSISTVDPSKCIVTTPDMPLAVGRAARYTVDTNGAGKGAVTGVVVMANETKVDAIIDETSTAGVYNATFTPICAGQASVTLLYSGLKIGDSPYQAQVVDISAIAVSGLDKKPVLVGEKLDLQVDASAVGPGKVEATIAAPDGQPIPAEVTKVDENQYAVSCTPEEVGEHNIVLSYAGYRLPDAPYEVGACNPAAVECTVDTPSIATLGETTEVKVDVSNAGLGEEELEVSLEGPVECPLSCKQIEDDVVYYSFQPEEPGTYTVPICYAGCPISKEPIQVTFVDPTAVDVSGPGVTGDGIKLHQPAEVVIDTTKSGQAPVEAKVTLPSGEVDTLKLQPQDEQHPEVLVASYTPDESGTYALGISFNDQPLADSPYAVYVPKNEEIALSGPGLSQAVVDEPNIIDLFMDNMKPEDVEMKFATPDGQEIPVDCSIKPINEDHCQVQYVPQEETTLCALPLYAGEPIGEKLSVEAGCPAKCKASGPGLEGKLTAGDETWFTVDTSEAGPGALNVRVASPDKIPVTISTTEEKPGVEKVTYTPTIGGDYEVAVTYNDADIPGSPFPVSVINPKAVTRDLISSPRITLGEPVELEVDTSEAGEGDLDYSVEGPVECPIDVCDHGDGAQTLSFTPTAIGTYHVPISYADLPVFEKPIEINVTDPSAVEVSGPGVTGDGIKLHQPAEVIVDTSKSGSAPVEAKVTLPSGEVDTLKFQPKDEQHPEVLVASYTPDESGNYALDVSFDDEPLTDSPYDVYVPKNDEFALSGPGLSQAVVDEPNVIDLFKDNVKPDDVEMKFLSPKGVVPFECEVKEIDKDHCQIVYIPEEEGALLARPLYAGEPIGHDLSIAVGNPSKCIVSGPGIESKLLAGKRTHFTIDATQAGPGSPKVIITTPSGFKLRKKMRKTKLGVYTVKYTPRMVGQHQVSVKYNKRPVDDSPYAVSVFNPDAVFYKLTEPRPAPFWKSLFRRKTSRTATLGETAEIKVDVTRAGLGEEELSVSVEGPTECSLSCRQTKDDILFYACCPETPGTYKLPITYAGCQISSKKPVQVTFVDPSAVDVSGSGVTGDGIKIRQPAEVIIDTSKSGSAPVEAKVTLPSGKVDTLKLQPKDEQHPEVLVANYKPKESGIHALDISFDDQPLAESPYAVYVPKNDEIALSGPGLSQAVVDEPNIIDLFMDNMKPEDVEMKFASPEGQEIPLDCSIVPVNEDHCQVQYVPQEETTLCALPLYAGEPIGAKIPIDVACPAKCKASGPGLECKLTAGDETWFTVDTSEAGPGALKVCVTTPDNVPIKIHSTEEKPGVEKVRYTPTIGGDYEVAVTYNDADIPGSPFPVSVINPKAVSRDLISSPRITLGEPVELKVDTSEAGKGDLDYSVEGPVECPIDVCDHGDGAQTLSFTPTAIGTYHVPISFAGLPVFDEPIEVTVTDPSAVEVSGPGVTGDGIKLHQPAEVVVDTSKSGSAPVEAKVTLPSGEVDTLKFQPKDEQHPEVLVASYTPDESGNYALDVSFDDEPLTDSPYDVYVPKNEEFALSGPGLSQAAVNEPNVIDLFKDNVKPDDVGMKFMSPNGKVVPVECEVKQIDKDHCQIVYIPEEEGALLALPLYANEPIGNEVSIAVAKPSKCIVSGPGVESKLLAGKRTHFTIDATQAGPGSPKVVITTPSGFKLRKKMRKTKLGVYTVKYTPRMVGQHQVSVKYNKRPVDDSPYAVSVFNPDAVFYKLTEPRPAPFWKSLFRRKTPYTATLGETAEIKVDVKRAGLGEEELSVSVEGPTECSLSCRQTKDDILFYACCPETPGTYKLPITYAGCQISSKKPVQVTFVDPSAVDVSGSGVTGDGIKIRQPAEVVIDTSKSGSAPVEAKVTLPSGKVDTLKLQPKDEQHPEVLVANYKPKESGIHALDISFDDQPLAESPYAVYVPKNDEIALSGPGLSQAVVDEPNIIDLFMDNMKPEDVEMKFASPEGQEIPIDCSIVPVNEDHCQVQYVPQEETTLCALPLYAGEPIGAKIPIDVACPAKCKASGPGLESKLPAGDETWFTVDTSEAGPGALKVCVATPDNVPIKIHTTEEKPGVEKVTYTPTIGGDYEVAVTYNDADIPGSPFPVSVINPKAVTRDLISSPRITLGEPVELEVDTSEAGEGDLDYSVEGPVECPIDVCDHGDGTQTLSFTPTAIGTYHVPISFAGLPIFDEPIEVTVTDPSAVEVSGPGVTGDGIKLNQPAEVIVDTSKSGSAPVEAKVTLPSGEVDTLKFKPKDEQHPEVLVASYTPDDSGNYALDVSFDDEPLTDSPYDVYVPKNEEFALSGPGLSQAAVGEPNVIDLFKDNVKPDDVGMKFMSPNGKVVPVECEVKQIDKDHCQIVYIPEEEGALLALPLYANEPIGNELSIAVAKPSKCIVSGPGVESKLLAGKRTQFTIDATKAGPGSPKVVITTPSGFKLRKKMRKTKLGMYTVKYTPRMVGQHQVSVKYNKRPVGGSPYAVSVFNPYAVSSKLIGPRLIPVGENISFAVDVAKAGEGELNVSVLGPEECKIDAKPTDKDDSYIFSFAPTSTGMYELPVTFDSLPTSRKPASVIITDISKVVASGSGVTGKGALLGSRTDVIVDTTESGPAPVKVMLTRPSKKPKRLRMKPKKNQPDVLVGHYTPRRSGHYLVQITFGNEPLPQSPYRVYIASAGDIRIDGPGAICAAAGQENVIDFFMENVDEADIGLDMTTGDEEKKPIPYTIEKVADDHCQIKYTPEVEAPIDANFSYAGMPVKKLAIAPVDPSKCVVTTPDMPLAVGRAARYTVDTNGAGKGTVTGVAVMANETKVDAVVEETITAGVFNVDFTPTCDGQATMTLLYSGIKIGESPYSVEIIDISGISVSGLDGEPTLVGDKLEFRVDTSAVSRDGNLKAFIEGLDEDCVALDKEEDGKYSGSFTTTNPGEYQLHILYSDLEIAGSPFLCPFKRPEPDASKVILLDVDQPGKFTVDARNGGGNGVLEVSVFGAYVPAHRIAVEHNGDFTFNVTYDLPKRMETTISVKWHGIHVCNSPFTVIFDN